MSSVVSALLNEGAWLAWSMALSFVLVGVAIARDRELLRTRDGILRAMQLSCGCIIGTMAFGHLLAVTVKKIQGALEPSLVLMYVLGLTLAVPAWWLVTLASRDGARARRLGPWLNGWLALALLALGLHNLPLAMPALLSIAFQLHSRRVVGWAIAGITVAANAALFVGSLIFWASGQTFEQFRGMP